MADISAVPSPAVDQTAPVAPVAPNPVRSYLTSQIARCKKERKDLIQTWAKNIDMRRGKVDPSETDEARQPLTVDWSLTKAKHAQMFSQTPKAVVTAKPGSPYAAAAPPFAERLNHWIDKSKTGVAMNEVVPDIINAAGVGGILVAYETRTQTRQVPAQDPSTLGPQEQLLLARGMLQIPLVDMPLQTDKRFTVTRLSPSDLLWPVDFQHSDFDLAPWVGFSGSKTWAEAKGVFSLTDDQHDTVVGEGRTTDELLTSGHDATRRAEDVVLFDEIYYWRYLFHEDEQSFSAIQRVVYVRGIEEPVIDEPWTGQRYDESLGTYVGACRFPVRFGTITYLTDEAIPPSDSAIGRPQVEDLMDSRAQMKLQRKHSLPLRWADVNRIDPDTQIQMMRGDFQGIVMVNGDGSRALGEIAKSSYSNQNFDFDRIAKNDLQEAWQVGSNQVGTQNASGEHSAAETRIVQSNFQTRVSQERAQIVALFMGVVDVLAGLVALFDDFELPSGPNGEVWDRAHVKHDLAFTIRPDASVVLDAQQRIDRIIRFIDITAKSGYLVQQPVYEELASLSGFDPSLVIKAPTPKEPDPPNLSFRFSGAEDLQNALAVALLVKAKIAPTEEEIDTAKKIILSSEGLLGGGTPPPPVTGTVAPEPPQGPQEDRMPGYQMADRVNKRRETGA